MHSIFVLLTVAFVIGFSSILKADEGEELKKVLPREYVNKGIKGAVDLELIKDKALRARLEAFCHSCTEVTKSVSMGVGGEMTRKVCSDHNCTTLCPVVNLPETCKGS